MVPSSQRKRKKPQHENTDTGIPKSTNEVRVPQRLTEGREILQAAKNGDLAKIRKLVELQPSLMKVVDDEGSSPLHMAAGAGHLESVKFLLDQGAQVDPRDEDGETPLFLAAPYGHGEVAALLLDKGASVGPRNSGGFSPLHFVEDAAMAELLLSRGADVNASTHDGGTPLHTAALLGHEKVVEVLLAHGADVGRRTDDGKTAFDLAAKVGHRNVAQLLMRHSRQGAITESRRSVNEAEVTAKHLLAIAMQISDFYDRKATDSEVGRIVDEILCTEKERNIDILGTIPSEIGMQEPMGPSNSLFINFVRTMLVARHINNLRPLSEKDKMRAIAVAEKMAKDLWDPAEVDGIADLIELHLDDYWDSGSQPGIV
jgi:ankyrin repeat protein